MAIYLTDKNGRLFSIGTNKLINMTGSLTPVVPDPSPNIFKATDAYQFGFVDYSHSNGETFYNSTWSTDFDHTYTENPAAGIDGINNDLKCKVRIWDKANDTVYSSFVAKLGFAEGTGSLGYKPLECSGLTAFSEEDDFIVFTSFDQDVLLAEDYLGYIEGTWASSFRVSREAGTLILSPSLEEQPTDSNVKEYWFFTYENMSGSEPGQVTIHRILNANNPEKVVLDMEFLWMSADESYGNSLDLTSSNWSTLFEVLDDSSIVTKVNYTTNTTYNYVTDSANEAELLRLQKSQISFPILTGDIKVIYGPAFAYRDYGSIIHKDCLSDLYYSYLSAIIQEDNSNVLDNDIGARGFGYFQSLQQCLPVIGMPDDYDFLDFNGIGTFQASYWEKFSISEAFWYGAGNSFAYIGQLEDVTEFLRPDRFRVLPSYVSYCIDKYVEAYPDNFQDPQRLNGVSASFLNGLFQANTARLDLGGDDEGNSIPYQYTITSLFNPADTNIMNGSNFALYQVDSFSSYSYDSTATIPTVKILLQCQNAPELLKNTSEGIGFYITDSINAGNLSHARPVLSSKINVATSDELEWVENTDYREVECSTGFITIPVWKLENTQITSMEIAIDQYVGTDIEIYGCKKGVAEGSGQVELLTVPASSVYINLVDFTQYYSVIIRLAVDTDSYLRGDLNAIQDTQIAISLY